MLLRLLSFGVLNVRRRWDGALRDPLTTKNLAGGC